LRKLLKSWFLMRWWERNQFWMATNRENWGFIFSRVFFCSLINFLGLFKKYVLRPSVFLDLLQFCLRLASWYSCSWLLVEKQIRYYNYTNIITFPIFARVRNSVMLTFISIYSIFQSRIYWAKIEFYWSLLYLVNSQI
jgi:hypothetical protein